MTSRILGVVREQVLAYYFGAGNAMDAYNVAYRVPNLLRDLFAEGAMSAAFVPTFARELATKRQAVGVPARRLRRQRAARHHRRARRARDGVRRAAGARSSPASYGDVPGKLELTVLLTRIMLPFLTFVALAAAFMGMLNALHHFFVPAVSPAMFNVGSIVCTVGLVAVMPRSGCRRSPPSPSARSSAAWRSGPVQWPLLRREGFRYTPRARLARSQGCGACCC